MASNRNPITFQRRVQTCQSSGTPQVTRAGGFPLRTSQGTIAKGLSSSPKRIPQRIGGTLQVTGAGAGSLSLRKGLSSGTPQRTGGTKAKSVSSGNPQRTGGTSQGTKAKCVHSGTSQGTRDISLGTSQGTNEDCESMEVETLCSNTPAMVENEEVDSDQEVEEQNEEVDSDREVEEQDQDPFPPKKKRKPGQRGKTKCVWLMDVGINEREVVEFNDKGQACSANATMFANWCGCIVRKHTNAPLNVPDWSEIPETLQEKMFNCVCEKFIIPRDEYHVTLVMEVLRGKYRNYRTTLKRKYFDVRDTYEERLKNLPPDVVKHEWKYLVDLFSSEKFQIVSKRNKANRAKQAMRHLAGTSSFAKLEKKETVKNGGIYPGDYHMFQKVHIDKKGEPSDPVSKNIMDGVEAEATQMEALHGDDLIDKDAIYDKVCKVVLPKKRRNRVPTFVRDFQGEQLRLAREEAARARAETSEIRRLAEESARRADESERKVREILADMANFHKQMDQMQSMIGGSGASMCDNSETQDPNA